MAHIGQQPKKQILDDYATYVNSGRVATFKRLGLDFVPGKREGVWIWDVGGEQRLLNCRSSGGVFNLGHRPPRVIEALKAALEELDISDHMLLSEQRARLGKRLAELTPGDLQYSTFSPGGAEAIEVALKLARGYTGRREVISIEKGYHGHTGFALATGDEAFTRVFGEMPPGYTRVPFADLEALAATISEETAAVIIEAIPATAGILIPPNDYFPGVRELCNQTGAQLIIDEVQTGLGRTGRLWAIEEWGVVPDMLVLGKGMSGALYPLSATIHRPHLESFFTENPFIHIASYGGSELGCVVSLAMLDEITAPGFLDHVIAMGERFEAGFADLQVRYEIVSGWRRRGLFMGVELVDPRMGPAMTAALANNGVLAIFANHRPTTLQVIPPLIIQPDEVDFVIAAFDRALAFITANPGVLEMVAGVGVV